MANLSSWGFDDIGAGRTDSFIEIFGGQKFTKATYVVNTVEFDPVSCSISKSRNFDTYLSQSDTYALRAYLEVFRQFCSLTIIISIIIVLLQ